MVPHDPPEMLTEDLMREFLAAVGRAGGHLLEYLLPPLPADEVYRKVLDGTGLTLPAEAQVWWSFHNGTVPDAHYRCLPQFRVIGVEEAVECCRILRNVSASYVVDMMQAELPALPRFEAWWFPLLDAHNDFLVCDASVRPTDPSPIRRHQHAGDAFDHHRIRARSVGEMVRSWIRAIDDGWYRFDEEAGFWDGSYWEAMSDGQKRSGIL